MSESIRRYWEGAMLARRLGLSFLIIPLFVGQINVKWADDALFSERYRLVPTLRIGRVLFVWRRWRKWEPKR